MISRENGDPSSDAGSYASAMHGEQAKASDQSHQAGAHTFEEAHDVIANNQSGGAGYFAEAHHTASLNIDSAYKNAGLEATRLGSTEFGSPDIRLSDGSTYNPKFYSTAAESYRAGAELTDHGFAKYSGQTILVPSDQLDQVKGLHSDAISQAYNHGDLAKAHALESIQFDDHIHHAGVESQPISYTDAQNGAETIRDGHMPEYVGDDSTLLGTGAEGALLAASIALATSICPQLVREAAEVINGRLTLSEAQERMKSKFLEAQTSITLGWAAARGGGAATATVLGALDPFGAALLVNLVVDTIQLSRSVQKGEVKSSDFGKELFSKVKDRASYTTLTAGAVWVIGPVGLLVPIIVRRVIKDQAYQLEAIKAWQGATKMMHKEFKSRVKTAALFDKINQHYRNAEASAEGLQRTTMAVTKDLDEACQLIGYDSGVKA